MDEIEKFEYQVVFNFVSHSIRNKKTFFSENFEVYVDDAKKFFREILRGLESVIEKRDYFFVKDLRKIVELAGYDSLNLKNPICGFKNTLRQLDLLKQNPEKFYKNEDALKLATLCEKIRDFYTPSYQVLQCQCDRN
ncbi:hypothetical protein KAT24_00180 [Candidatus Pacearchaeota archaeon]|nr:hypothetical protein [Candidatus Pacearchaeota archaeon]